MDRVHLAFRADSRAEVDRLHEEIKAIGAFIVASPRAYPEYTPAGYYAFFFKDPDGINLANVDAVSDTKAQVMNDVMVIRPARIRIVPIVISLRSQR